jgi:O-antigen ligase
MHAIFGGGLAFWPDYVVQWSAFQWVDAHNVYLNQLLMYGLVGVGLFAAILLSLLRSSIGTPNIAPATYSYVGALFAMTGSYVLEPSFASTTQKFQLLFLAALLLGDLRARTTISRKAHSAPMAATFSQTREGSTEG